MSNRDRITRAAEEARLELEEKAAKKAKKASKAPAKSRTKDVRMKVVWVIYNASGKPVKTYSYPDKDAGTTEAQRLTVSSGHPHELRAAKVPMD
jgi:hypothetical protein